MSNEATVTTSHSVGSRVASVPRIGASRFLALIASCSQHLVRAAAAGATPDAASPPRAPAPRYSKNALPSARSTRAHASGSVHASHSSVVEIRSFVRGNRWAAAAARQSHKHRMMSDPQILVTSTEINDEWLTCGNRHRKLGGAHLLLR